MRLTTFTDYSLRVLIFVAARPATRTTIGEIATSFGISEHHLTKVVHALGKSGFLTNVRGRGGGLTLARPARDINVGAVVRATEGAAQPAECFAPDNHCTISRLCRLRGVLGEAVDAFYGVLDACTLEDLARNRPALAQAIFISARSLADKDHPRLGGAFAVHQVVSPVAELAPPAVAEDLANLRQRRRSRRAA